MSDKRKFILLNAFVQVVFACCILTREDIPNWIVISPIIAGSAFVILHANDDDED